MINLKTEKEIEAMKQGGKILAKVLTGVLQNVKPGVSEIELDKLAEKLILKNGARPGFKEVPGYNYSICVSTNDVVVHGIPTDYKLKAGDVIGIDCGVFYKGFHTDMAQTLRVSNQKSPVSTSDAERAKIKNQKYDEIDRFLEIGKKALSAGIKTAKSGSRVGHISKSIQDLIEGQGYSVVKTLVGHGVGKKLHEEPEVPGYLATKLDKTPLLKVGMTIAVEVIYNMGEDDVIYKGDDGWTISTGDHSLSGLFERTIAITKKGPVVLTN